MGHVGVARRRRGPVLIALVQFPPDVVDVREPFQVDDLDTELESSARDGHRERAREPSPNVVTARGIHGLLLISPPQADGINTSKILIIVKTLLEISERT